MAGQEYTGKDKTVSKMTRDGLTEENLRDGSVEAASKNSRDGPKPKDSGLVLERERLRDSDDSTSDASSRLHKRMSRYSDIGKKSDSETDEKPIKVADKKRYVSDKVAEAEAKAQGYSGKLRQNGLVPDDNPLNVNKKKQMQGICLLHSIHYQPEVRRRQLQRPEPFPAVTRKKRWIVAENS